MVQGDLIRKTDVRLSAVTDLQGMGVPVPPAVDMAIAAALVVFSVAAAAFSPPCSRRCKRYDAGSVRSRSRRQWTSPQWRPRPGKRSRRCGGSSECCAAPRASTSRSTWRGRGTTVTGCGPRRLPDRSGGADQRVAAPSGSRRRGCSRPTSAARARVVPRSGYDATRRPRYQRTELPEPVIPNILHVRADLFPNRRMRQRLSGVCAISRLGTG